MSSGGLQTVGLAVMLVIFFVMRDEPKVHGKEKREDQGLHDAREKLDGEKKAADR